MSSRVVDNETLRAVADLSTLLSIGWDVPAEELAAGIISGDFTADLIACAKELSAPAAVRKAIAEFQRATHNVQRSQSDYLSDLRTDRTMLFDIPQNHGTWPFESQHRDVTGEKTSVPFFISKSATQIKELFDEAGIVPPDNEPPDHLCSEFDFIAYCAGCEGSDTANSDKWSSLRRSMGTEHLKKWIAQWSENVVKYAETPFYRDFARVTAAIVESDLLWKDARASFLSRRLPIFPK